MLLLLACFAAPELPPSPDCDDADAAAHPAAPERCDGVDNDCDGAVDEDATDALDWHPDADGDGFGDSALGTRACDAPAGYLTGGLDCDDADAGAYPGAVERCDGEDDDCDGVVDDGAPALSTWYADADGDGHGDADRATAACRAPDGAVAVGDDCDDGDATVHPDAPTLPSDGVDQDCDGRDEAVGDADGDGALDPVDCDDTDPTVFPEAAETCGTIDRDCDGVVPLAACADLAASALAVEQATPIQLGTTVAFVRDQDGDGLDDLALGAPYDDTVETRAGSVRVVTGALRGASTEGVVVQGDEDTWLVGRETLLAAGDADGDGWSDVLVGGGYTSYLLAGPIRADGRIADARARYVSNRRYPGATAGDLDGDGVSDAAFAEQDGTARAVVLLFGPLVGERDATSADLTLVDANGDDGEDAGAGLAMPGDLDGDGVGELVVGAPDSADHGVRSGAVAIVAGAPTGTIAFADADAILTGDGAGQSAGSALASAGDTDGDGLPDLLVGVTWTRGGEPLSGFRLLRGGPLADGFVSDLDAAILGRAGATPSAVGGGGDVDGDGLADVLVGVSELEENQGGAFLFYAPFAGGVTLDDAALQLLPPEALSFAGTSVALDGDVDGDGLSDLLIGTPTASSGAFLLLGSDL